MQRSTKINYDPLSFLGGTRPSFRASQGPGPPRPTRSWNQSLMKNANKGIAIFICDDTMDGKKSLRFGRWFESWWNLYTHSTCNAFPLPALPCLSPWDSCIKPLSKKCTSPAGKGQNQHVHPQDKHPLSLVTKKSRYVKASTWTNSPQDHALWVSVYCWGSVILCYLALLMSSWTVIRSTCLSLLRLCALSLVWCLRGACLNPPSRGIPFSITLAHQFMEISLGSIWSIESSSI